MSSFKNTGEANYRGNYSFSWLITDRWLLNGENEVYFGLNGVSGAGRPAHLANSISPDDAEAIGYSLLAAAKAAREVRDDD